MKNNKKFYYLLFFMFILVSCEKYIKNPEEISNMLLINNESNPVLAHGVVIRIENNSDYCIQFPTGYNLKIFAQTLDEIIEIPNDTKYIGEEPIQLEKKGSPQSSIFISFSPRTQDLSSYNLVDYYVEITGHLCTDKSVIIRKKIPFEINQ